MLARTHRAFASRARQAQNLAACESLAALINQGQPASALADHLRSAGARGAGLARVELYVRTGEGDDGAGIGKTGVAALAEALAVPDGPVKDLVLYGGVGPDGGGLCVLSSPRPATVRALTRVLAAPVVSCARARQVPMRWQMPCAPARRCCAWRSSRPTLARRAPRRWRTRWPRRRTWTRWT